MRLPALRTLPSRMCSTPSSCAICAILASLPLNENADVRAVTFNAGACISALNDLFSQAVAEVLLFLIAAHIDEWQNGCRRPLFEWLRALFERRLRFSHGPKTLSRSLAEAAHSDAREI